MAACIVQRARTRSGRVVPAHKHYFGCVPRYRAYEAVWTTKPMAAKRDAHEQLHECRPSATQESVLGIDA